MPTVAGALRRLRRAVGRRPDVEPAPADKRADLLDASPLFDHEWYALVADRPFGRREAIAHYLSSGRRAGLTPHPLFDPALAARSLRIQDPAREPLAVYLRRRRFRAAVHPLFDAPAYAAAHPESLDHPAGPVGHVAETAAGRDLVERLRADARGWVARQRIAKPAWGGPRLAAIPAAEATPVDDPRIGTTTVVLVAEQPGTDLGGCVQGLLQQTTTDWELVVLGVGHVVDPVACGLPGDERIRVHPEPLPTAWAARNEGLAQARGTHVAWLSPAATWTPGLLSGIHRALLSDDARWAQDCLREDRGDERPRRSTRPTSRERLLAGVSPELDAIVVARDLAVEVGGFDLTLAGGHDLDFLLRLSERGAPAYSGGVGVVVDAARRAVAEPAPNDRPWVDYEQLPSSRDAVLNRHAVDWAGLERRAVDPGLVSVLVPTYQDWEMTTLAVDRVFENTSPGLEVEVIVVDNGCGLVASAALGALAERHAGVRVVRSPVNHGFSLGNNLGLAEARGATIVFLNNDTEVQPGWLEPLLDSLTRDDVLGVQSLLLYPDRTVQSAGVVFPRGGGIPHVLLQGFPVEDTVGLGDDPLHALTGAAVAMRYADAVALRGFDPVFRNGMEDIDICLRLAELRPGRFVVRPDSVVLHHESRTPGRFVRSVMNRRVLMDRWHGRLPEDDVAAWRRRGYAVVGHQIRSRVDPDRRLCVPEPVLTRLRPAVPAGAPPRLRWALKIGAPAGPEGEKWGDTHFARHLADALRELGQDVVIDPRQAIERESGAFDDVVVVLRGLERYTPLGDQVNLMWLISHPDDVGRSEHVGYDRVYVASTVFARQLAEEWGAPAVPLLQATDPEVFHPDLAEPDTGDRVLFIGNSRKQARPLVVAAADQGLDLSVYGTGWEGFVPERCIKGIYLPNEQVGAAYRAAGVVLNDHWADMHRLGFLSNRLFDAVAAGARVVTDDAAGVEEVFGEAVRVVRDPAELAGLLAAPDLDAVFGDDATRRARAARVAAEHSFDARAATMLADVLRIRGERGLD